MLASAMEKGQYHYPKELSLPENIFLNFKLDVIISTVGTVFYIL